MSKAVPASCDEAYESGPSFPRSRGWASYVGVTRGGTAEWRGSDGYLSRACARRQPSKSHPVRLDAWASISDDDTGPRTVLGEQHQAAVAADASRCGGDAR